MPVGLVRHPSELDEDRTGLGFHRFLAEPKAMIQDYTLLNICNFSVIILVANYVNYLPSALL